jgi:hypothetical protein
LAGLVVGTFCLALAAPAVASAAGYAVGPISDVSSACSNQNAEVEQAVDPSNPSYVYELWMGCSGIGFARSTNGGASFSAPLTVPGSGGNASKSWDPAIAVDPHSGVVYASFMYSRGGQYYPVVAASTDHGSSFSQVTSLLPPAAKNWGDRDFIAVGPDGAVYLTWDYGPERTSISYVCNAAGSCSFASGDLNVVIQKSTDGGKTFGPMVHVSPGFPASGADSGPLVVQPNGTIDVLYQGYPTNPTTYALAPANEWFTSSADGGASWSPPVEVGAGAGTMSTAEWWIDGDLGIDSGGNLYATWDVQGTNPAGSANDIGLLSYSRDGGATWSTPTVVPADTSDVPHIVEVVGAGPGIAYVGWLSNSGPSGYAEYLRTFSTSSGWLSAPFQVSQQFGASSVWPGDTFGISTESANRVVLSWGSAVNGKQSEIFAAGVSVTLP